MLRTLGTFLVATIAMSALPAAASAVGYGDPVIVSPSAGSIVAHGWRGPITVDFSNAAEDIYDLTLECADYNYYEETSYNYTEGHDSFTWSPPAPPAGSCSLEVSDSNYVSDVIRDFTVDRAPLATPTTSVNHATFYPLVADGYLDTVTFTYHLSRAATTTMQILNSSGTVVRSVALGTKSAGSHSWQWGGRRNGGKPVSPGTFRLRLTASAANVTRRVVGPSVAVRTRIATQRVAHGHWGDEGTPSASGSCHVNRSSYDGTADLDCWGGRYAQMTYGFALPARAYDVWYRITHASNGADICCDGRITRSGARTSATHYRVTQRVSGWRAATVTRVVVHYTIRKRI